MSRTAAIDVELERREGVEESSVGALMAALCPSELERLREPLLDPVDWVTVRRLLVRAERRISLDIGYVQVAVEDRELGLRLTWASRRWNTECWYAREGCDCLGRALDVDRVFEAGLAVVRVVARRWHVGPRVVPLDALDIELQLEVRQRLNARRWARRAALFPAVVVDEPEVVRHGAAVDWPALEVVGGAVAADAEPGSRWRPELAPPPPPLPAPRPLRGSAFELIDRIF